METIIGANCLLNIVHKPNAKDPEKIFANVATVMPLLKGLAQMFALEYERRGAGGSSEEPTDACEDSPVEHQGTDDEVPF